MESKKLKDFKPGDQLQLGKYSLTMLEVKGVGTGVFIMDTLLDKNYPRAGFKSRADFMEIIKTEPDFEPIARRVLNARLLYANEMWPQEGSLGKQYPYFRDIHKRLVRHRSVNSWPDKNLLMDYDPELRLAKAVDPETGCVVTVNKYEACGVRLLLEIQLFSDSH